VQVVRGVSLFHSSITIADNGSTDATFAIARELEQEFPQVRAVHLSRKGRRYTFRTVWSESQADVVS